MKDDNSDIYIVTLDGLEEKLMQEFTVKEPIVRRVHHHTLPGKNTIRLARHLIYHRAKREVLASGEEIISRLREDRPYTYVITGNHMIFTESTRNPMHEKLKNFLSKHYMICGLHGGVRYSGEFFIYPKPDSAEVFIVFDNASGTYQPDGNLLPEVQEVLQENFDGDEIHIRVKRFDQKIDMEKLFGDEDDYLYDDPGIP
jgi:hypothetical protein